MVKLLKTVYLVLGISIFISVPKAIEDDLSCKENTTIASVKNAADTIEVGRSDSTRTSNSYIDAALRDPLVLQSAAENSDTNLHLFSHGRPGELLIDGKWLQKEELVSFIKSAFLLSYKETVTLKKRLNIYGCNFAQGEKGKSAIAYLEKELDLNIAASTNVTGASGDWILEVKGDESALEVVNYLYNLQSTITSVTTDLGSQGNIATLYDGNLTQEIFYFDNNQNYASNADIFNITFNQLTIISQLKVLLDRSSSFIEVNTEYKIQGRNGSTYTDLTGTIIAQDSSAPGDEEVFDLSSNTTGYIGYRILWTGGGQIGWDPYIEEIVYTEIFCSVGAIVGTVTADDPDADGINNNCDLDDDNDGILDTSECETIITFTSLSNTASYVYAQNTSGGQATHFGDLGSGDANDPENLFDGNLNTEFRQHENDIVEFAFGQTIPTGAVMIIEEGGGGEDAAITVYVSNATTDAAGDGNSVAGNGTGYTNTINNSNLIYSGASGSSITFTMPIDATHVQFVGLANHGDWGELRFDSTTQTIVDYSNCDLDNDGIPNHLDTDSDGDGCSDAIEGGANFDNSDTNTNDQLTGSVDSSGVPNMASSNGQSVGSSQNAAVQDADCVDQCDPSSGNIDSDGDGITDVCDLDDDNDGILDSVEQTTTTTCATTTTPVGGVPNSSIQAGSLSLINDSVVNADNGVAHNSTAHYLVIDLGQIYELGSVIKFDWWTNGGNSRQHTITQKPSSAYSAGGANSLLHAYTNSQTIGFFEYTLDAATQYVQVDMTARSGGRVEILEATITTSCTATDTDGDGIPNYLDSDSDNDGCSDAIEGGASFDDSDTNTNDQLAGSVDSSGVPTIASSSGQSVGSSQNAVVLDANCVDECDAAASGNLDTDGDGVSDICDLDDDNDGILDTDEGSGSVNTDNDGLFDSLDRDSDNDGCDDVLESGGLDGNGDGVLDNGATTPPAVTVNSDGRVTNGTDGYNGITGNEYNATQVNVTSLPANQTIANGDLATFSVITTADTATSYITGTPNYGTSGNANTSINYQWYLGDPATTGIALTNSGVYSGVTTANLNISNTLGLNGSEYFVQITHDAYVCGYEIESAILSLTPRDYMRHGKYFKNNEEQPMDFGNDGN